MRPLISLFVKRAASAIPLFLFIPFLTFLLMHFIPGNYFDSMRMNPQISSEMIARYESMYHLDQPLLAQYFHWLANIIRFDFGYSFAYQEPVLNILGSRLVNTLLLTGSAFLLAWVLALFTGLWAGMRPGRVLDRIAETVAYFGLSIPNFFLCLLLLWGAAATGWLPLGGIKSIRYDFMTPMEQWGDRLSHMILPVFVLALSSYAYLFRFMRSQTKETANRDFVFYFRTLRVPESKIIYKHVARNALNPMVTLFGMELPALFSGAALVEIITGWPGLGSMMLQAVRTQDVFLVMGNILMIAFLLVIGNLLADGVLLMLDPRIRMKGARA